MGEISRARARADLRVDGCGRAGPALRLAGGNALTVQNDGIYTIKAFDRRSLVNHDGSGTAKGGYAGFGLATDGIRFHRSANFARHSSYHATRAGARADLALRLAGEGRSVSVSREKFLKRFQSKMITLRRPCAPSRGRRPS